MRRADTLPGLEKGLHPLVIEEPFLYRIEKEIAQG
jgi:hypothetical protein